VGDRGHRNGAGLAASLAARDEFVIEFDHPSTRATKDGAKSDALDAVRAARETLGRKTWATPRARGAREGLRTLIAARDTAKGARVVAINLLKALVVTAPVDLRGAAGTNPRPAREAVSAAASGQRR